MDIDSPIIDSGSHTVIEKLARLGVPEEHQTKAGLVEFIRADRSKIPELVSAILPMNVEVVGESHHRERAQKFLVSSIGAKMFQESMDWIQWLMFEDDPIVSLKSLAELNVGQRGVCGAVWGHNDIAYRCRTCETDATCAICVSCFQNGDHSNHDYSIKYTGGGCCDCGDETAWKREGFCSQHKGSEQIQQLPETLANSVGPVLDAVLACWKNKLSDAESVYQKDLRSSDDLVDIRVAANEMTLVLSEMLLEFSICSESLLSFVSRRIISSDGLLNILVKTEWFLHQDVVKRLHEFLLRLIGDPIFKCEFAKAFVSYYPVVLREAVKKGNDNVIKKRRLLSTFSVQILTVPTIMPLLVKEMNLLAMLLDCLGQIFVYCAGEDGVLQVAKWERLYETSDRVICDLIFVLSHAEVSRYATLEQRDLSRSWLILLTFAQGTNPLKRETGIHIEEENEYTHLFSVLGRMIASIHSLLVNGVYSDDTKGQSETDDADTERQTKVGRLSHEDSVCSSAGISTHDSFPALLPSSSSSSPSSSPSSSSSIWFIRECLKVLDTCLVDDEGISKCLGNNSGARRNMSRIDIQSSLALEMAAVARNETQGLVTFSMSEWPDIRYDVSTQAVSVHLPLHRLLSLLIKRALRVCYGESAGPDTVNGSDQNERIDFFRYLFGDFHPYGFSAFAMEHALRIRVFCAQVIAGMWRRNGDAALLSCEFYRAVHWSDQGLELDIFLLQYCAALAPADSYVNQVLARFGLSSYLSLGTDRSNEYEAVLVKETLTLLIQILQERRFCGLSDSECLRREIIYRLATGDATHSQIVKSLPRDLIKSDAHQEILDNVSVYRNPSGTNQGKYSLKASCWKELDLYHPRWHSKDMQAAEERYSRFCGVSALTTQLPKWRKIYPPLMELAKIGTCRATLQIISSVLYYALYSSNSEASEPRAPDGVLITALHLLSLSLDICTQQRETSRVCGLEDSIPILDLAGQEIIGTRQSIGDQSLLSLLVSLMRKRKDDSLQRFAEAGSCNISSWIASLLKKFSEIDSLCNDILQNLAPEVVGHSSSPNQALSGSSLDVLRKAKARERQAAIMAKMKAEQSKFLSALSSSMEEDDSKSESETSNSVTEHDSEALIHEVCALCHDQSSKDPVCFLIFLQKSKLLSMVHRGPPSWDRALQSEKESMDGELDLFGTDVSSDSLRVSSPHLMELHEDEISEAAKDSVIESLRARLMKNSQMQYRSIHGKGNDECNSLETLEVAMYGSIRKRLDGMMHHDNKNVEHQLSHDAQSSTNSMSGGDHQSGIISRNSSRRTQNYKPKMESASHGGYDGFRPSNCDGINLSSCGHAVHQGCLERYLTSLRERSVRRNVYEGAHIVDLDRGEFLCPVCRRLANSILPASRGDISTPPKLQPSSDANSDRTDERNYPLRLHEALCLVRSTAEMIEDGDTVKTVLMHGDAQKRQDLDYISDKLWDFYFSDRREKCRESLWLAQSLVMWDTLKYTLISMETVARGEKTSDSLYEEFKTSSGSILSLLLRVVQSTRTKNAFHVRQRFTGMQLFAESICSGVSGSYSRSIYGREGTGPGLLKNVNPAAFGADVLFWNRASDPILARDPFTSLMWVLFCLPAPFISCEESLLSLVHIFYVVSLVQTTIAYCAYNRSDTELTFKDSLVTDIKEYGCGWQYFKSKHMDLSCGINETLGRCSFPYLRRCALLWRLLKSASGELIEKDVNSEEMDYMYSSSSELDQLRELFKIPPIESILRDELLRALARKWLQHFVREYEVNRIKGVMCITPAVPFQLMKLPHLYQDLLQRCVKQRCSSCRKVVEEPALCLLCGRLCSPAWRPCCRDTGCQTHAMSCGAGTGVFLLIRRTTILLQRCARQSPWPSPYLDMFGEEDMDMRRGKPLYLNEERYAALTHMVASHGLDQSTKVLSQTIIGTFPT